MQITDTQKKRITWMLLAAGGVVAADAMWSGPAEPARAPANVRPSRAERPAAYPLAPTPASLNLQAWAARGEASAPAVVPDLFAQARPAAPVAPPVVVAVAASAPRPVPPFPYTYMGGMLDDGVRTGFFTRGERLLRLRAGDVVDGAFRVDSLGGSEMTLTYLPLGEPLRVAFGGAP